MYTNSLLLNYLQAAIQQPSHTQTWVGRYEA